MSLTSFCKNHVRVGLATVCSNPYAAIFMVLQLNLLHTTLVQYQGIFLRGCNIVGTEMLEEVVKREKEAGIRPEPDVDTFMKATALPGSNGSLAVEYVLAVSALLTCFDMGQ